MAGYALPQHVVERRRDGTEEVLLHQSIATFRGDVITIKSARSAMILPVIGVLISVLLGWLMIVDTALPLWGKVAVLVVLLFLVPISVMALINSVAGAQVIVDATKQSATWQQGYLGMGIGTKELVPFWKIDHFEVTVEGEDPDRWREHQDDLRQFALVLVKENGKRLILLNVPAPAYGQEYAMDRTLAVGQAIAALTDKEIRIPESWQLVTIDVETGQPVEPDAPAEAASQSRPPKKQRRKRRG